MYHGGIQVTPPDYTNPTKTPPFRTARQPGVSLAMTMEVWVDLIQPVQFEGPEPMLRDDNDVRTL